MDETIEKLFETADITCFAPTHITVHHSATDPRATVDNIRRAHQERGWSDIGYHVLIRPSGEIEAGRPLSKPGAHVRDANSYTVGVCCVGDYSTEELPSPMMSSLERVLLSLQQFFNIAPTEVLGHSEMNERLKGTPGTICPGDPLRAFLKRWRSTINGTGAG